MAGTTVVSGDLSMQQLGDTLTRDEQLGFERVTGLVADQTQVRNLVTMVSRPPTEIGGLSVVPAGAFNPGTKVLSTTAYISGTKTAIDLYRAVDRGTFRAIAT